MILPLILLVAGTLIVVHSNSCSFCQDMCSSTHTNDSVLCKCDADCLVFGDCCDANGPPSCCPASLLPPLQAGVMLDCISTYLYPNITLLEESEAFLMVSTCPDSWIEMEDGTITEDGTISENCRRAEFTTALPPVTNTATGMVYRNEYCAVCNGVREPIAWQTNLVCNQYFYELLSTQNITDIFLNEPDVIQTECRGCSFRIPTITTAETTAPPIAQYYGKEAPRSCTRRVSSCLPRMLLENKTQCILGDETYALMEEKCVSGALDLVRGTSSGVVYRNHDCAICNADNMTECYILPHITNATDLCYPIVIYEETTVEIAGGTVPSITYIITLTNLGGGTVTISKKPGNSLDCPGGTAPVGLECQPTKCPEGYSEMGGRCSYVLLSPILHLDSNITMVNCSTGILVLNDTDYVDLGNDTIILVDERSVVAVMDYDEFGRPIICIRNVFFLDCLTALIPLNDSDYTDLGDNSIIYKNEMVEVTFHDKHGRPLICPNNTNSTTHLLLALLPGLQELAYIGCSLSVLGTILMLLTYTLFSELRTLPGLILMNLCTTILATNLIFIIGGSTIRSYPVKELCSSLAIVLHFSYLAQFAWMSIFSCEMTRKFHRARKLMIDSNKTKHRLFGAYLGIGWGLPLLVASISITLNFFIDELVLYGVDKDGGLAECWINHFRTFIMAFLLPLILCLSCNLLMFLLTTILLCRVSRDQSKLQVFNKFILFRVWLAIFSITGLTWIFGFIAIPNQLSWMWYPFVIFNSTQGLSIFIAFLFTKKTVRLYIDLFTGKRSKKQTLTSSKKNKAKNKTTVSSHSKIGPNKKCTTLSMPSLSSPEMLEEKGLIV